MRFHLKPTTSTIRCAYCHDGRDKLRSCERCGVYLHKDCWEAGCPTLGCRARKAIIKIFRAIIPPTLPPNRTHYQDQEYVTWLMSSRSATADSDEWHRRNRERAEIIDAGLRGAHSPCQTCGKNF